MAKFELKLPKMGESVAEATITNWLKEIGETVEADEPVFEIATDKVDSEVPSEVDGVLIEKLFETDDVVQVGQTIAIIETSADGETETEDETEKQEETDNEETSREIKDAAKEAEKPIADAKKNEVQDFSGSNRFYSPLVKNIAKEENIPFQELENIPGTGKEGRVTKNDILGYLETRPKGGASSAQAAPAMESPKPSLSGEDEIIEMSRMGKMIAHHMVESNQTAAHVQSFIEVDVTNIWNWRKKNKDAFQKKEGEKLTFTPIFMEAVAKAIRDFPM
ncbi:MAG TPA: biotin/lipoyl-containing protein, partial [Salinimicrobium sp.]|nr:biotin/lipoyl-containing protein [Salinimicrobium sp.]